jgi:hypothetical protein
MNTAPRPPDGVCCCLSACRSTAASLVQAVEPFLQEDVGSSIAVLSQVQIVGGCFPREGEWDDLAPNWY